MPIRLTMQEVIRVLRSRKWLIVAFLCLLGAYLSSSDLENAVRETTFRPTAWDVHATALNSLMIVGYLVFVAYVVLVGGIVVDDRESGYGWIVVPRAGSRLRWWAGKIATLLLIALVVQLAFLGLCLLAGAVKNGWSLAPTASAYASAGPQAFREEDADTASGQMLFAPVEVGANMAGRQLVRCLYETFAFTAMGTALVALTVRFSKAFLPITVALLGLVADFLAVKAFNAWRPISPGRRLLESVHATFEGWQGIPWWTSLLYWAFLLLIAALAGAWALRRVDL